MKKILLSIMMAVSTIGMVSAAEATFDFTDPASLGFSIPALGGGDVAVNVPIVSGNVTITCADNGTKPSNPTRFWGGTKAIDLRAYKNATFTLTAKGDNITSIVIKGGKITNTLMSFDNGTYDKGTWTGSSATVVITMMGTVNFDSFVVTTVSASGVASPVFAPAGGEFYEAQSVELTCPTEGATIYYTTDGTTPSTSSTKYTAPVAVSATTTIKAIASKGGVNSDVAEATYTIKSIPEVEDIAAFLATNTSGTTTTDLYKISNEVKVLFQSKPYLYITDNSGYMQVYGQIDNMYTNGDIIPAGIIGSVAYYGGIPQMTPQITSFAAPTAGTEIKPESLTVQELSADLLNHYILLSNVSVNATDKTLTDATGSIAYFNRFTGVNAPTDNQKYDVLGIMNSFNGTLQVFPVKFTLYSGVESTEESATSVLGGNGAIAVNVASDAQVLIVNPFGQTIVNKAVAAGENRIDVTNGLYIVKVDNVVKKVVVR